MAGTVIVFAPHPDDETLACGGTMALKARGGHDVHVVFMTDGRNSHLHQLRILVDPTPQRLAQIRKEEARRALTTLGVQPTNLAFLGFEDGTLSLNMETAKAMVCKIMVRLRPEEIYYPDASDAHRDHHATFAIVEDCLSSLEFAPRKYRYVVWASEEQRVDNGQVRVRVDIGDVLQLKQKAIHEYRSQVTLFSRDQTHPVLPEQFLAKFQSGQELFVIDPVAPAVVADHRASNQRAIPRLATHKCYESSGCTNLELASACLNHWASILNLTPVLGILGTPYRCQPPASG